MDLGKPLKSTGGANLSDTLPPFQLILVGVHWRQIGQRLENLVQSAPACQQLCSSFSLAQHGWPDYPVTFSQRQCGTIMELLQYKTNPFMWIIYALCLYWSSISELHVFSNTHSLRKPSWKVFGCSYLRTHLVSPKQTPKKCHLLCNHSFVACLLIVILHS